MNNYYLLLWNRKMTNTEYRLKFPIGAAIRYTPDANDVCSTACKDIGRQGTVTAYLGHQVKIHLPTSEKRNKTWRTLWKNITLLSKKNEQLLFSFMSEAT